MKLQIFVCVFSWNKYCTPSQVTYWTPYNATRTVNSEPSNQPCVDVTQTTQSTATTVTYQMQNVFGHLCIMYMKNMEQGTIFLLPHVVGKMQYSPSKLLIRSNRAFWMHTQGCQPIMEVTPYAKKLVVLSW